MTKVSEWLPADDYCACRVIEGTDPTKVENRVAFIEKTPRVRHCPDRLAPTDTWRNWACAPWKGSDSDDEESRKWCDDMLILLGYELP